MRDQHKAGFATRAIHTGHNPADHHGALNPPVYLNATYAFASVEEGQRRFAGEEAGYLYSRVGNPTVTVLEQKLASLEGGEAALVPDWPGGLRAAPPLPMCG